MGFLFRIKNISILFFLWVLLFNIGVNYAFAQAKPSQTTGEKILSEAGVILKATLLANPLTVIPTATTIGATSGPKAVKKLITDGATGLMEGMVSAALPVITLSFVGITGIAYSISGLLLGLAGNGLDLAMQIGTIQLSEFATSTYVEKAWETFRNIANVGIIFTIVFIAIKTILRSSGYEGKQLLGRVIIASLLLNFSFLIAAIVVDISNVMSTQIYNKVGEITGKDSDGKATIGSYMTSQASPSFLQTYITGSVDKNTGEQFAATFSQSAPKLISDIVGSVAIWPTRMVIGFSLGTIVNLVLACILVIVIFTIYSRVIVILFLLVTSPIAFAGMILPGTQKVSKEWWESLVGHSFFLPVFLLFFLVGLELIGNMPQVDQINYDSIKDLSSNAGYAKMLTPFIFKYVMVLGIFMAALTTAKKVSSMGSAAVGKISTSISSTMGGAASAGAAFIGRNTAGRGLNALSNTATAQRMGEGRVGSLVLGAMKGVAGSSFDARESRAFKGVASATGFGGDFNNSFKSAKGGFTGQEKRAVEARIARAGNLQDELTEAQVATNVATIQSMEALVASDTEVKKYKDKQELSQSELEIATQAKDAAEMTRIKKSMASNKILIEAEEKRVKGTTAYTTLEKTMEKTAKQKYGEKLQQPMIQNKSFAKVAPWVPFNGRAADAGAAKKILKEKSENEKLIDAINKSKTP